MLVSGALLAGTSAGSIALVWQQVATGIRAVVTLWNVGELGNTHTSSSSKILAK